MPVRTVVTGNTADYGALCDRCERIPGLRGRMLEVGARDEGRRSARSVLGNGELVGSGGRDPRC